jgi:proton-translocating NADH-quinone oxidoreductase chain N
VLLSSIDYLRGRTAYATEFYSLLFFVTLSIVLVAGATDLLMIYLSIEFLSLTSYVLTGYLRDDQRSNEAAIKYFLYGSITSAVMLYGMSLLYGATGTTNLAQIAAVLQTPAGSSARGLAFPLIVLLMAGFGFKIALVPFHQWAPDAYEGAPTPVTAFLSVGPKAAGFAALLRVLLIALPTFQVDWVAILAGLSILTMTLGNLVAIVQRNIKRMLAYSSIAQAGYIIIGLVAIAPDGRSGVNGLLLYILAYLFTNLGAFVAVIAFGNATGSELIEDFAGLIRRQPLVAGAMVVFLLSLAGIPPTAGFVGKFFVFAAAIRMQFFALAAIGVVNSVISVYYYANIIRTMFFLAPKDDRPVHLSSVLSLAIIVSLAMVFIIGLYPQPFIDLATRSASLLTLR